MGLYEGFSQRLKGSVVNEGELILLAKCQNKVGLSEMGGRGVFPLPSLLAEAAKEPV